MKNRNNQLPVDGALSTLHHKMTPPLQHGNTRAHPLQPLSFASLKRNNWPIIVNSHLFTPSFKMKPTSVQVVFATPCYSFTNDMRLGTLLVSDQMTPTSLSLVEIIETRRKNLLAGEKGKTLKATVLRFPLHSHYTKMS